MSQAEEELPNGSINCKNCNKTFCGKYCNYCGQEASTGRLNAHFLFHELQHSIINFDKGIFYTVRELFIRPGTFLRSYIEGKRINYVKPFTFLIVLSGLYSVAAHFAERADFINYHVVNSNLSAKIRMMNIWNNNHYIIAALSGLPLAAIISYIYYKKLNLNFIENLVINAYLNGQKIIINFIVLTCLFTVKKESRNELIVLSNLFIPALYFVWAYTQFFSFKIKYILRATAAYATFNICYILLLQTALLVIKL